MKTLLLTAFCFASFALHPCMAITHTLSGTMEVFQATTNAGNVGNGTGTISGDYDTLTNTLNYTIAWADLTDFVTSIHFHLGVPGVAGGVVLPIAATDGASTLLLGDNNTDVGNVKTDVEVTPIGGTATGLIDLGDAEIADLQDLIADGWYVNVHTSLFPGGEIRGQVNVFAVPEPTSGLLLGMACLFGLNGRRRP